MNRHSLSDPRAPDRRPAPGQAIDRRTDRWRGVNALALFAGGVGVLFGRPSLLLAGAVGIVLAAYAAAASPPEAELHVERRLSDEHPDPGTAVTVTLRIENAGDTTVPDLRIVDGVPEGLDVVEGSPRHATALRPGKAVTYRYTVRAGRGKHAFDPVTALVRGFSGAVERELALPVETTLRCAPQLTEGLPLPLLAQTTPYTGRVGTDAGGAGTEFHAVREYRKGDPLSRIDWARAARTGEFATVEYRQERAAEVVLVVDTRTEAYLSPPGDGPSAVERSVAAAGEAFTSLLDTGDRVGLAAFGPEWTWLAPATGADHRAKARALLGTDEAFPPTPSDEPFFASLRLDRLRRHLPANAQLVLFSPLADDDIVEAAKRLTAYGHGVTVISPDPSGRETAGQRLAAAERQLRLSALRRAGIRVLDWGDESLAAALATAATRWSA
ncbi:DUF58 domain-containing protein [Natronomonas sp. EA1]|uniref:DUF58 domain-containing protein n=1 Tax=Natronomonas sp. EA1 TaxID=3421655 RepID=UPI003EBD81C8